jgi:hypothetical protein
MSTSERAALFARRQRRGVCLLCGSAKRLVKGEARGTRFAVCLSCRGAGDVVSGKIGAALAQIERGAKP